MLWFTVSWLHPVYVSKFILEFFHWNVRLGIFSSVVSSFTLSVTFCCCFKAHFGIFSLRCKTWNIFVVFFFRGLSCHCYNLLIFQSSFWIIFVEMSHLEYFLVLFCGLHYHCYILLIFQSSIGFFFLKM
jgi:hypothetical protein